MKIYTDSNDLVQIVADLVKQGLQFEANKQKNGDWLIELTGGF